MVPLALASKVGNYEARIDGVDVKVKIITHPSLLTNKLSELQKELSERRVVGIDAESSVANNDNFRWVVLCVGKKCLLIDLRAVGPTPEVLKSFLEDVTICFVGLRMSNQSYALGKRGVRIKTGLELGYLAALVKKKPSPESCSLESLVREFGFVFSNDYYNSYFGFYRISKAAVEWRVNVFSEEDMPRVVREALYSYFVGEKLLRTVF